MLPYFAGGERTPIFRPQGTWRGRGPEPAPRTGPPVPSRIRRNRLRGPPDPLELLDDAGGGPAERILAVGGGTKGGLWTQIVSDVTGRTQLVPEQTIGASYGGALLAGIGTGLVPADTDWARLTETVTPNPDTRALYDELYQAFTELYPATRRQVHVLADIQESSALGRTS